MNTTALPKVTWWDIEAAQERLAGIAFHTWVLRSRHFDEKARCHAFFKTENMQRTGSLRFRGAFNKIKTALEKNTYSSIVTYSTGNYALAVALTAKLLRLPATIVLPEQTSRAKIDAISAYGAEIIFIDSEKKSASQLATSLCKKSSLLVTPTEDFMNMAGEATAATEFLEEVPELNAILVPCKTGGVLTGCVTAVKHLNPAVQILGVSVNGSRLKIEGVDQVLSVTEDELLETQLFLLERLKILVEPFGCAAAAAIRFRKVDFCDQRVGAILTGGNVDFNELSQYLTRESDVKEESGMVQQYFVHCHSCQESFDAVDAPLCNCLTADRTFVCPRCLLCFCKAPIQYKDKFWAAAPQILWDKRSNHQKQSLIPHHNPEPWETQHPLVLIVDHDRELQNTAEHIMNGLGLGVIVAGNGEEGLRIAREYKPELVITDALMPKMDGREMCRQLKSDAETAHIKVIIITALYTQSKYRSEAFKRFHVDEYLSKPVSFSELQSVLQKYL